MITKSMLGEEWTMNTLVTHYKNRHQESEGSTSFPIKYCSLNHILEHKEIYAIIPIADEKFNYDYTCILYKDTYQIIQMNPMKIVNYWLSSLHITYEQFCDLIGEKLATGQRYFSPVTNGSYALFPISSAKNNDTIWLNPSHIQKITNVPLGSNLHLSNHFTFTCNKHARSIETSLIRALDILILTKKSINLLERPSTQSCPIQAADNLGIPKEAVIRKKLHKLDFNPTLEKVQAFTETICQYKSDLVTKSSQKNVKLTKKE